MLGFSACDECFGKWEYGTCQRNFATQWGSIVDAKIEQSRDHPSVIIWGVDNEETKQYRKAMLET